MSILPAALVNPGDYVLMTTPGYPVFGTHSRYYGGLVHNLPLTEANAFLPDLDSIPADVLRKSKVLVINYPNNPTGACADDALFEKTLELAKRYDILVCHDAAYSEIAYDGYRPKSILEFDREKKHCLEFHSLSKTYCMTGWRIGFAVGCADGI